MKEKIYEKMREYGWNLGYNKNIDFEEVYKTHYNFIESCYDYISDYDINEPLSLSDINTQSFEDMITFMSDFLRAINDIDETKRVGESEISLYNSYNIPYSLSNMCLTDTKEIEYKIRKSEFNGNKICNLLNNLKKDLCYYNWEIAIETNNMITLKGNDDLRNVVYLEIRTK